MSYYTLITNTGQAALAAAAGGGLFVALTHMAFGDASGAPYDPVEAAVALVNERHRRPINRIYQHEENTNWIVVECVLPADVGGWYIREAGVITAANTLFAIAKYPETYKAVTADGVGTEIVVKIILVIDNPGDVEISIDPSVVSATQAWVIAYHATNWAQSDWNEADDEDKAHILNKPDIPSTFSLSWLERLPLFPEAETVDGKLAVAAGVASVIVAAGQTWLYRGWKRYSADDYTLGQRTLATVASKTYHLRWTPLGGFALKDLADVAYNATAAAETAPQFDTTPADMLIARVVTNGANVATITTLVNRQVLDALVEKGALHQQPTTWAGLPGGAITLNWARTPRNHWSYGNIDVLTNVDMITILNGIESRYGGTASLLGYTNTGAGAGAFNYASGSFRLQLAA